MRSNISTLRKAKRLSLSDLSELLKNLAHPLSQSVISLIEIGKRRVDVDDLVAFSAALDVSPADLINPNLWIVTKIEISVEKREYA